VPRRRFAPRFSRYRIILLVAAIAVASPALAADDPRWAFSLLLGGHLPDLQPLNEGLFRSPFTGEATILVREGGTGGATGNTGDGTTVDQNDVETFGYRFENPLPNVGLGAKVGLEFQWQPNDRHGFIFGFGSWEKTAINRVTGNFPLQQHFASNVINSERRGAISYTEYTLGWRYNLLKSDKFRLYSRLTVNEVFDIDYREDFVFYVAESQIEDLPGIRRDMVVTAQTAALFMGQIGLGGEWFLRDWFSLGLEGGYMIGQSSFMLRDVQVYDDFVSGDSLQRTGMPFRRMSDGTLGYLLESATYQDLQDPSTRESYYRSMRLGFDGWTFNFRLNFYLFDGWTFNFRLNFYF